jgi:hypothetical protein
MSPAAADLGIAAALLALLGIAGEPGLGLGLVIAIAILLGRALSALVRAAAHRGRPMARRRDPTPAARLRVRGVRVVTMAALIVLVPAGASYLAALFARSNASVDIRSVEWLRDNGAAWLVSDVERLYYTLTAPAKGGPSLSILPSVGVGSHPSRAKPAPRRQRRPRYDLPPRVRPVVAGRLPFEGVWRPTQRRLAGAADPPLLVTDYRPDPNYPRIVAGLAWINARRTSAALFPGIKEPPGAGGSAQLPAAGRSRLLASFNSGFKHKDGLGGFYSRGRLWEPMVPGMGTIVATTGGRVDVRSWHGGSRPGPGIAFARQNLPLIVDHGRASPNLSDGPEWGATLGNAVLVWRSGIGVDRHHNLIYAAADHLTVKSLARALAHAGAVRAVELDINSFWVSFISYGAPGARYPHNLLPDMTRPATRYLTADDRDFFAVYAR